MAERRTVRTKRRPRDEEPPEVAEDELADEPEDELADEPEDELADEPEDELADEPEDELADEPEDELADEPEDEPADEPEDEPAEEDSGRERRSDRRSARQRSSSSPGKRLNAAKAGRAAMSQITELTGKEPEGITGVDRGDDGWVVGIEVVEDRRVPSSTDVLAIYEIELDMDGELMSYRRVRRYARGRGDDEGF